MKQIKEFQSDLEKMAKIWQLQLNLEYTNPNKNVRLSFKDIGSFGEHLATYFFDGYIGSGSGGMGFDLINFSAKQEIEVKTCCTIQNSTCKNCKMKFNSLFLSACPKCKSTQYTTAHDSRFGINSTELLRQHQAGVLNNLTFCYIQSHEINKTQQYIVIQMNWYTINFNNNEIRPIQLKYFQNQKNMGKKDHANLLPNSYDFFKLVPIQLAAITLRINYANLSENPVVSIDNTPKTLRVPANIMTQKELKTFQKLSSYDPDTKTADIIDFTLHMPYRKKTLGKRRGDTRKKVDSMLK